MDLRTMVSMTKKQRDEIKTEAFRQDISMSELVRRAVDYYLKIGIFEVKNEINS